MAWRLFRTNRSAAEGTSNGSSLDFRPLPCLGNAHVQTLLGHWWRGAVPRFDAQERLVRLSDGDRLATHDSIPPSWQPGGRVAVLVHGLGGCHLSGPMMRLSGMLLPRGFRVIRVDLRGAGRGAGLARRLYNGGCSADIRAALAELHSEDRQASFTLIGTSLGGNIVLKLAGEAALEPVPGLTRVAAIAPPIDLERCAALIALRRNRLYEIHFVRCLVRQVREVQALFPELPQAPFPRGLSLRLFDELYTAPRGGFVSALDYYQRSAALPLLPEIQVPTLILTARDDPFIAVEPFENLKIPGHIAVHILARGGHVGFLGCDGQGGVRWAEQRVADWVAQEG